MRAKPPAPGARASDPAVHALAVAALEIGQERAKVLDRMKRALLEGDDAEALRLARVLTGLEEDVASDAG